MKRTDVSERLLSFIRERFLQDDPASRLDAGTPLLDWGIVNSMNIAELLAFIHREFDHEVPPDAVVARNFRTVNDIATMITG
ncbi:acyl carrier protein [Saccharopolyspora sp. NPDC000359]|uniref:acyl carrier protein n=1 Tax=Saccharopolyspora sp. NPDC000359 TaxID=3154251 RepID=UPI00332B6F9E